MLHLVATPIGDFDEISLRALRVLREAEIIICESTKETSKLLRHHEISGKRYEILDEHSTPDDVKRLGELCKSIENVALVSDSGTPGFCDPGADLVRVCQQNKIPIGNCLGASSLMGLISLSGRQIHQFLFRGFLSQQTEQRKVDWRELANDLVKEKRHVVLMDTPYRMHKLLQEAKEHYPLHTLILATDLGSVNEKVTISAAQTLDLSLLPKKAEFMLLVCPN